MATTLYLYSHLRSAAWSKLKPSPARHPAPAAVCESKGWQGTELLALRARSQVERGEAVDNSEGGNATSKPILTSDWHFSSGCKEIIREIRPVEEQRMGQCSLWGTPDLDAYSSP